jgi:hypothetical protein
VQLCMWLVKFSSQLNLYDIFILMYVGTFGSCVGMETQEETLSRIAYGQFGGVNEVQVLAVMVMR